MAASSSPFCSIPVNIRGIETIYLLSVSNQMCVGIAFKDKSVQQAAERVFCQDYWEHNALIGLMPAATPSVDQRRCVCTMLPSDSRPLIEKILAVIGKIGSERGKIEMVPLVATLNLFETIQSKSALDRKEDHGR